MIRNWWSAFFKSFQWNTCLTTRFSWKVSWTSRRWRCIYLSTNMFACSVGRGFNADCSLSDMSGFIRVKSRTNVNIVTIALPKKVILNSICLWNIVKCWSDGHSWQYCLNWWGSVMRCSEKLCSYIFTVIKRERLYRNFKL